jgi:flagellar hook-length control protein FliK
LEPARAAASGDAPEAESPGGFLAALGAAQPAAVAPPASKPQCASSAVKDADSDDPVAELAAVIAAMLPASTPPAQDATAVVQAAAAELAAGKAPSSPATAALRNWLAGAGAATADSDVDVTIAEPDTNNPGDGTALSIKAETTNAGSLQSPVQVGLRQLLELMGRSSAAPHADAQVADQRAVSSAPLPASLLPAMPLGQGEGDAAATAATSLAHVNESAALPVSTAAAPNAMLAAASTNFGSPVNQPAPQAADPGQTLHATVGTARWADELGSRMTMMTLRGQHEGSLNLTPEHLGPVEVRISVSQNTANIWFGAQHADARAALAEALPRLREMFGAAGMTLGHAGVSQQAPRQGSREGELARVGVTQANGAVDVADPLGRPQARRIALGLVDTYV